MKVGCRVREKVVYGSKMKLYTKLNRSCTVAYRSRRHFLAIPIPALSAPLDSDFLDDVD